MLTADGAVPLGAEEAAALLAPLADAPAMALAVSGGADSLALLHLAARWRAGRTAGPALMVLTVDHRLRPESAAEAAVVMAVGDQLGLPARTLPWEGPHPESGIEEAARDARYALLEAAAVAAGASHLLTAHHQDDQAETFLMRLARGSGVDGLGAMRAMRPLGSLTLFRPFLGIPKSRLVATCRAAGLLPADDPGNRDPRFARARLRRLAPILAGEGLDAPALARAAGRIARAAEALEIYAQRLVAAAARFAPDGAVRIAVARLAAEPREIRLRALALLLAAVGGGAPRAERLEALEAAIASGRPLRRTLGGAVVTLASGEVTLRKEPPRGPKTGGKA